ncbi:thioesterase II family protein [Streptomyces sp. NPDC056161]|uniref:thioesterase II family protein n=1 Tax=Streptomyces sp. NPDC056161 TaxID=3345732 RepID=UPI0035D72303
MMDETVWRPPPGQRRSRRGGSLAVFPERGTLLPAPHLPDPKAPWLRRFRPRPKARFRLVCFPHAGGSATYYSTLAQSPALAPTAEVPALQYPGRQHRRREQLMDSIPEPADRITASLTSHHDHPPTLFGHSMGAVLAFAVARRRQERSENQPNRLFVSGRRAPSRFYRGTVHLLGDAEPADELRRVGSTDPRFLDDEEPLADVLPVARNDYQATEEYRWDPPAPLSCPVTALVGDPGEREPVRGAQ